MQTYSKFAPTGFDHEGAFLEDQQEWLVVPVGQTRDSGELDQSNFDQALEALGGEGDDVEVHRFGHWGPGWFEIIIVRPGTEAAKTAEEIEEALENYPVLNEEDFSRREWEAYEEGWDSYGYKDFIRKLKDDFNLNDACVDIIEDIPKDDLREFFQKHHRSGEYYSADSGGVYVNLRGFDCEWDDLVTFLRHEWEARKTAASAKSDISE